MKIYKRNYKTMEKSELTYGTRVPQFAKGDLISQHKLIAIVEEMEHSQAHVLKCIAEYLNTLYYRVSVDNVNSYKFELPPSHLEETNKTSEVLTIGLPDVTQPFNNSNLSEEQLKSLWVDGTFKVKSNVEEVDNVWKVTPWLVVGTQHIRKLYDNNFVFAIKEYLVSCELFEFSNVSLEFSYRFTPHFWSGITQVLCYFLNIVDLLVGLPTYVLKSNLSYSVEQEIESRRLKFLRNQDFPGTKELANYLQLMPFQCKEDDKAKRERIKNEVTMFNERVAHNIRVLTDIYNKVVKMYNEFETNACKELGDVYIEDYEKFKRQIEIGRFDKLLEYSENQIPTQLSISKQILIAKIKSLAIIDEESFNLQNEIEKIESATSAEIKNEFPYYSQVEFWLRCELKRRMTVIREQKSKATDERIIRRLKTQELREDSELYAASITVLDEERKNIKQTEKEIHENLLESNFKDTIYRRIWASYKVKEIESDGKKYFINDIYASTEIASTFVLWRIYATIVRWVYYSLNLTYGAMQYAYSGEFGLKGLVCIEEYYMNYSVDCCTGEVKKNQNKVTPIVKKFMKVLQGIRHSRDKFESEPNVGMFGKNLARIFNYIENYFLRFFIVGVLVLCILHPLMNVAVTAVCLIMSLTSYIWSIVYIGWCTTFRVFIFDYQSLKYTDYYQTLRKIDRLLSPCRYFPFIQLTAKALWGGIIQISYCLLYPTISGLIVLAKIVLGFVLFCLRYTYSYTIFHLIVKRLAKVPVKDTNLARKIAGPGISRDIFYSLKIEDCVILILLKLETHQYTFFKEEVSAYLRKHYNYIQKKYSELLVPFSYSCGNLTHLIHESTACETLVSKLDQQISEKINKLSSVRSNLSSFKIRFSDEDLERLKVVTEAILISFINQYKLDGYIWKKYAVFKGHYKKLTHHLLLDVFDNNSETLKPLSEIEKNTVLRKAGKSSVNKRRVLNNILEGKVLLEDYVPTKINRSEAKSVYLSSVDLNSVINLYVTKCPERTLERHLYLNMYD